MAIQSLLKAGFRRAVQVELFVISPLQIDSVLRVSWELVHGDMCCRSWNTDY